MRCKIPFLSRSGPIPSAQEPYVASGYPQDCAGRDRSVITESSIGPCCTEGGDGQGEGTDGQGTNSAHQTQAEKSNKSQVGTNTREILGLNRTLRGPRAPSSTAQRRGLKPSHPDSFPSPAPSGSCGLILCL